MIKGPVIKPSDRIQKEYQKSLEVVIKRMNADLFKGIMAAYGRYESGLAQDAKMPAWLTGALNSLFKKWQSVFDSMAEKRAKWFNDQTEKASTKQVEAMLKDIGFTVEFKNSQYINDILQTQLKENVDLIKSIPAKAHEQVKAIVKHGVEAGSDRAYVAQHLQKQFGVTQRRAQFITRDQTNKANAAIAQARSKEAGIEYGFWMHRGGTKVPRPTHVAMNGKRFKLEKGLYDSAEGRNVKPGELYNCFPGSSELDAFPFIEKLYRRFYSGELANVITDSGTVLKVTPNHPILTTKGWKPAGLLNISDYLIQVDCNTFPTFELNSNRTVTTFEEFFDSFVLVGITPTKFNSSAGQFHGDISDSEVYVIDIASFLSNKGDSHIIQRGREFGLSRAEIAAFSICLAGMSTMQEFFIGIDGSTDGIVSGFRNRLSVFWRSLSVHDLACLALISGRYPGHKQSSANSMSGTAESVGNFQFAFTALIHGYDLFGGQFDSVNRSGVSSRVFNPTFPKINADTISGNPDNIANIFKGHSPAYKVNRIVDCGREFFSGHVYNLQTSLGLYIAQKTISCNCNCAYRADLSSFNPQIAKDSVTVRPRPLTYDDLLKSISSPTRKAA